MKTCVSNIGNIAFRPSLLFKPYSLAWTREIAFGKEPDEKVIRFRRKKYFDSFSGAVIFRRRLLHDFRLQSGRNRI